MNRAIVVKRAAIPLLLLAAGGCMHYDQGAPIPPSRFRDVPEVTMEDLPTTRPATSQPTTAATLPTTRRAERVTLTLAEARRMAIANNLDIRVDLIAPTISKQAISEEEAQFEALFTTNIDRSRLDQPTASQLESSSFESFSVRPGVSLPLRTGGTLSFDTPVQRSSTNNQFSTLNPAWTAGPEARLSQPLLRGFGLETNEAGIRIAKLQYQQQQARTKLEIITVLADVDRVYWRLYAARQELIVRKQEYDLAVVQMERARRQVNAGAGAQVDVVRAESGVADRLEIVITAENAVRDRERDLKRFLHEPGLEMDTSTVVVPESQPTPIPYNLDASRLADMAMQGRMELLDLQLQIAADTTSINRARNATLPLVSLDYTYRINGLGPNFDDSLAMTADRNFEDNTIGLRLEIPIGNQAARSRLRRALATRMQTLATKAAREEQIREEVLAAVDTLNVNWQRILAARERVVLAARVVEAEVRQYNLGLQTSTDVLDAQARLANAKTSEILALTQYQIAQVDIAFATGTLLGASHVKWAPTGLPGSE